MAEFPFPSTIPIEENILREFSKHVTVYIPNGIASTDPSISHVKPIKNIIDALLKTAAAINISAAHRAAACNSLIAVIEKCQVSETDTVRHVIWEDNVWMRLFEIFLERSDNAKAKSMKLVLILLSGMLLKNTSPQSIKLRDEAVLRFLDIIFKYQNHLKVKPALQGLAYFISKKVISVTQLIDLQRSRAEDCPVSSTRLDLGQDLLRQFLRWIPPQDTATSSGHLVTNFLIQSRQQGTWMDDHLGSLPMWAQPLDDSIRASPEAIEEFKNYVFPEAFRLSLEDYLCFLEYLRLSRHLGMKLPLENKEISTVNTRPDGVELSILLAALQAGKEIGLIKDVDYDIFRKIEVFEGALHVPDILFGRLMAHSLPTVRLASLSLLVSSAAITRPITRGTFKSLKRHLNHLHADTDANFRSELLSHLQRLFDRMRAATATLGKALANNRAAQKLLATRSSTNARGTELTPDELHRALDAHMDFILWYIRFLGIELRPTASYQRHVTALRALMIIMRSGLDPGVSLQSLSKQAQGELKWQHQMKILNPWLLRSLFDLVLNPFDDVRNGAAAILKLEFERKDTAPATLEPLNLSPISHASSALPDTNLKHLRMPSVIRFIQRAERLMLRTGRADHADGVARWYELLFSQCANHASPELESETHNAWWGTKLNLFHHLIEKLEETIEIARGNLSLAVNGYPVHGLFASLRYIVDEPGFYKSLAMLQEDQALQWKWLHERIFICLESVWYCVREILCNDAPEGHVPEDLEDEPGINTKDILSYSWRALKEASALLRAIISKAPVGQENSCSIFGIPQLDPKFEMLGRLCFTQLAELRHRGAFSTVAQTFAACCQRCANVENDSIRTLPETWYQDTLLCIRNKASMITRRSAGIPSMVSGIVSAEPGGPLFMQAMHDLFYEASLDAENSNIEESRLPQVHALNCLKEIFTATKLASSSESYIGKGLDLAASKIRSHIWPIRNCGLMLFKALIDRLLGSSDSQRWKEQRVAKISKLSYSNYPNLFEIMVSLLVPKDAGVNLLVDASVNASTSILYATEAVFPALQILQQAPLPLDCVESIRKLVFNLTKSPHWHVRDMAARTYATGLQLSERPDKIDMFLSTTHIDQNSLHGLLLSLKYIIRIHLRSPKSSAEEVVYDLLLTITERFENFYKNNSCPITKAAYLDVLNLFGQFLVAGDPGSFASARAFGTIAQYLGAELQGTMDELSSKSSLSNPTSKALLRRSILRYLVFHHISANVRGLAEEAEPTGQLDSLENVMGSLAEFDPDNFCEILEDLREIFIQAASKNMSIPKLDIINCIHQVAIATTDSEVKSKAQLFVADALVSGQLRSEFFDNINIRENAKTVIDLNDQTLFGSPSCMESALRLQGYFLDHVLRTGSGWNAEIIRNLNYYIRILQKSLHESNPFPIRYAAISSISSLHHIWTMDNTSVTLRLSLLVYDALNDDDDEIRDIAAHIATRIMLGKQYKTEMRDAVPLLASQRLTEYLARTYPESKVLCEEALRRLVGCGFDSELFGGEFEDMLGRARKEDNSLFVQEKQNLFVDGNREAVMWSRVLRRVSANAVRRALARWFAMWVMDGIALLTTTARTGVDGPLGWTSKPDVFALGMRVVYGAEVLLDWRDRKSVV